MTVVPGRPTGWSTEAADAVLAPPSLSNGETPVAQVGYPPLAYVDPQLLRGEGGRWSDVWALGATIHQVVTGSAPFRGMEDLPVVQALEVVQRSIDRRLRSLLARGLVLHSDRRRLLQRD